MRKAYKADGSPVLYIATAQSMDNNKQPIDKSFNQIVITLRQISSGIESFALSTKTITNTVNEMKNIAFKLSNMKDNI